jgi:hypothetical protein
MKILFGIFILLIIFSCDNVEFKSLYPANPPAIELHLLTALNHGGLYAGDYLLLLRSENRNNSRFGGFLIFINSSETAVLQMETQGAASYILGSANGESSSIYNPATGIDTQLAILFMSSAHTAPLDNTIIYNSKIFTLTKVLQRDGIIITGSYFTMRSYLWDNTNNKILDVSDPGNVVQIE